MGTRQTFGLLLLPMQMENGVDPWAFGLAVALHNLMWGLAQPVAGSLADKHGTGRVMAFGGIFYLLGCGIPALWPNNASVLLGIGFFSGLGVACAGTGMALAAIGRMAPPEKRGELIGLASAGGSMGQAFMVPLVYQLSGAFGAAAALGAAIGGAMLNDAGNPSGWLFPILDPIERGLRGKGRGKSGKPKGGQALQEGGEAVEALPGKVPGRQYRWEIKGRSGTSIAPTMNEFTVGGIAIGPVSASIIGNGTDRLELVVNGSATPFDGPYRTHLVSQETANLRNKSRRKQRWILVVA
jgi:MFS family permease